MTPNQQKLIDAAAEAYGAALVKGAANPYIPALEAAVTVALKAAVREAEEVRHPNWSAENEDWCAGTMAAANAISSLIPAQEKTSEA
jgi:hypothetical protein